ncbi:MAG: PEP-CTERM sorting domain-containing protein [Armatimonadetes bacterium]|nr:PEP-CTERM sorting domain-containing protein [Armatimonadota bacterium]
MALASVLGASASAALLYSNAWDGGDTAFASQNDTTGGGYGNYATTFAGFNVGGPVTINEVSWVGMFFNNPVHGNITGFTLNFYSDNAGSVGSLLSTQHFNGNASETSLGNSPLGFPVYGYDQNVAGVAISGAGWVSIVADLAFPPQWGLASGVNTGPLGYQTFFGSTNQLGNSVNVKIYGDRAVPEPASMTVLGLGVAALARKRRAAKRA